MDVFVDTETVRLDPVPGRVTVWEIGVVTPTGRWLWQLRPELGIAQPEALRVGRFAERALPRLGGLPVGGGVRLVAPDRPGLWEPGGASDAEVTLAPEDLVVELLGVLAGACMWGSSPEFDARHLRELAASVGMVPSWWRRTWDVASAVAGWCSARGVKTEVSRDDGWLGSDDWSRACGVDPARFDRHTALGDALWCREQWIAIGCPSACPQGPGGRRGRGCAGRSDSR